MTSAYSTSASGDGRESGDSVFSGAQETPSTTVSESTRSMPDIFVWAPEEERTDLKLPPQCAFDSTDPHFDFGLQQDPLAKLQLGDTQVGLAGDEDEDYGEEVQYEDADSFYDDAEEEEEEEGQIQVVPRKSGVEVEVAGDVEPVVFTRESIFQQTSPPPPPVPEKEPAKNFRNRAASFIKSLGRSNRKASVSTSNSSDTRNQLRTQSESQSQTRRATSQDIPSSDRDTLRSKRSLLFHLTRRNKSTTALSRVSTESELSLDPDPFSSSPSAIQTAHSIPPVPPIPAHYEYKVKRIPPPSSSSRMRRQATEPDSLRKRASAEAETSPPLPPLPQNDSPTFQTSQSSFAPSSQSTTPIPDLFSSFSNLSNSVDLNLKLRDSRSSPVLTTGNTPMRSSMAPSHAKLPSLHFDGLSFDSASF